MSAYIEALGELVAGRSALDIATAGGSSHSLGQDLEGLYRGGAAFMAGERSLLEGLDPNDLRATADTLETGGTLLAGIGGAIPGPQQTPAVVTGTTAVLVAQALRKQAAEEEKRRLAALQEAERMRLAAEKRQEHRDYRDRMNAGRDFGQTSRNDGFRHSSRDRPLV